MAVHIQRPGKKQQIGCAWKAVGCAFFMAFGSIFACAALYTIGALTPVVLQLAGMRSLGSTDRLFDAVTPAPTVIIQGATNPQRVTIDLGNYGQEALNVDPAAYTFVTGSSDGGAQVAVATFTEQGLLDICIQRSAVCSGQADRYRNVRFDLRPGGMVVYADVNAGIIWQRLGVVLRLDSSSRRFNVLGVDIDGVTFDPATLPPFLSQDVRDGIAVAMVDIEREGNAVLNELELQTGGQTYTLSQIVIDDTTLTIIMR